MVVVDVVLWGDSPPLQPPHTHPTPMQNGCPHFENNGREYNCELKPEKMFIYTRIVVTWMDHFQGLTILLKVNWPNNKDHRNDGLQLDIGQLNVIDM